MSTPYLFRLLCVSGAAFFLIHMTLALLARLLASAAIRVSGRLNARSAERLLLALRLAPAAIALLTVAGLCVPSYLWLEPDAAEELGFPCLIAAALSATLWVSSLSRVAKAIWHSRGSNVWFGVAGLIRPRVVISPRVLQILSNEELAVALRHEEAHHTSLDNLKRLLMMLSPDGWLLPEVECTWAKFAEWAADDSAVEGDASRSLALSSALVKVARLGAAPSQPALITPLLADSSGLAERVERLLEGRAISSHTRIAFPAVAILASAFLGLAVNSDTLVLVHDMLETLVR